MGGIPAAVILILLWFLGEEYFVLGLAVLMIFSIPLQAYFESRDRSLVKTGLEGMVGKTGVVKSAPSPEGKVLVRGELWNAKSENGSIIEPGTKVEVLKVDGMELVVRMK